MLKKILSLWVILTLTSVGFAATTLNSKPTQVYTEEKLDILVTKNQPTFTIRLKSNPTTGFSWFLREYDSDLITPVKHQFIKQDTTLMGAPGFEEWTFKMKPLVFSVPHQTTMRFVYARPWQGSDASTQVVFRVSTQAG